jgi:EAL domain-containing protein (putative c-di-GMP-specific phosphodiesterase class I)
MALVWLAAGVAFVFVPLDRWAWAYFACLSAQVVVSVVTIGFARRFHPIPWFAWTLVLGIFLSGVSVVVGQASHDWIASSGLGLGIGAVALMAYGVCAAILAQPLLGVAELRRPVEAGIVGFGAVAMSHVWLAENRTPLELGVLGGIATAGAACMFSAAIICTRMLRAMGRAVDCWLIWSGVLYGTALSIGIVLLSLSHSNLVGPAGIIGANGFGLGWLCHPNIATTGTRLRQHTDQEPRRALTLAAATALGLDGVLAVLRRVLHGDVTTLAMMAVAGVQFVGLTWIAATWWDSEAASNWRMNRRLVRDLRRAVARSEIEPHYQPIVRTADGVRVGYEALARWNHPTSGLLPAGRFIGLAEAKGYLASIDRQMLLTSARDFASLTTSLVADEPFVTINLTPKRMAQEGFAHEVVAALENEELSGEGLVIEMTESSAVSDWAVLADNLAEFHRAGIGFAIDDFGTGHANIGLLCQLDVDLIKLDRSLIELAMQSPRGAAVVHGAIQTARATGALIVAEGVSNSDWIAELAVLGVDLVQGFGVGLPQPVGELRVPPTPHREASHPTLRSSASAEQRSH